MKRSYFLVLMVMAIFAVISVVTNILGPLEPSIQDSFHLSSFATGLMSAAFFIAYGVMSIPAGILVERIHAKPVLVIAFLLSLVGSLLFAWMPVYAVALPSLFIIAVGFAMLQVVINPLLRVAGGKEHYAFFGNLSQIVFGGASFLSPYIYSSLVTRLQAPSQARGPVIRALGSLVPPDKPWASLYWVFAIASLAMLIVVASVRIPRAELEERERVESLTTLGSLLRKRTVILFFLGVFCYVGTEQGVAVWMSKLLKDYHGVDPLRGGAGAVSAFWGLMMVGCALGLLLVKLFDSRKILVVFAASGAVTLLIGLFGPTPVAMVALPLMGFWCSIMWPVVFALALNSVDKHHGSFAGILCTGIVGGAFVPPLIGKLDDHFGLRAGMLVLLPALAYLLGMGLWARPLVNNATLGGRKEPGLSTAS